MRKTCVTALLLLMLNVALAGPGGGVIVNPKPNPVAPPNSQTR